VRARARSISKGLEESGEPSHEQADSSFQLGFVDHFFTVKADVTGFRRALTPRPSPSAHSGG